jgi:hypothetical protein
LFLSISSLVACGGEGSTPTDPAPLIQPVLRVTGVSAPVQLSAVVATYDLTERGAPLGVTVEPGTGRRLVLSSWGAIYDLDDAGTEPLWTGVPITNPGAQFTDMAALGEGRVALTSFSDGYILDLATGELSIHFCYEPGWWEPMGNEPIQLSFGVAHDPEAQLLYAQPRTVEEGGFGAVTESFIASYDEAGGADLDWWAIEDLTFVAGGIVVLPEAGADAARLILGAEDELFIFDTESSEMTPAADLSTVGVSTVGGLALDASAGTFLVADPNTASVVEIRREALGI